ncbi:hypothetical protein [Ruminiclostridium hungatei]|uniref:hypothetical protein n=1 Tax=Ruminiclostridium hungatei TaxID=48256 RepID=UPI001F61E00A|nr:hypothetical protein [Ruminiclostridium hungatei]
MNRLFSESQAISLKNHSAQIDFLRSLVLKKELVMVGVDLFYWIQDSICWNRNHWEHYSLINGYDDEKKVFYVLDENNNGYDEFEVPEERFLVAVQNSPLEPHGYVKKITRNIGRFKLSLKEVMHNAERLKSEIEAIGHSPLWQLSDADFQGGHMCDLISMYIFQIINRHKANAFLFNEIRAQLQNSQIVDSLIQYSQDIQEGWTLIKNILVRTYFMDEHEASILEINKRYIYLMNKEYEMWNKLVSGCQRE